jgi:TetR/AcrR family fatty acid metabolism transcriptional regulator
MANGSSKRKRQSEKTKQLIYEHATNLFREKGYYNVSIQEIVKKAGVSVGAFYHHFNSKEEIVLCWADELDQQYSDFYKKIKNNSKHVDALDKIKAMIFFSLKIYSSLGREFTAISYFYMMREPKACSRMLDPERSFFKIINNLIEKAKLEGSISQDIDNMKLGCDIVKIIRGAILDWCINGGNQDIIKMSETLVETFIRGVATKRQF